MAIRQCILKGNAYERHMKCNAYSMFCLFPFNANDRTTWTGVCEEDVCSMFLLLNCSILEKVIILRKVPCEPCVVTLGKPAKLTSETPTCGTARPSSRRYKASTLQLLHSLLHLHHGLHVLWAQHLPHCVWIVHHFSAQRSTVNQSPFCYSKKIVS